MKTVPIDYLKYDGESIISNFDDVINNETVKAIKGKKLYSTYPAYNFYGDKVWWENGKWHCEVWIYKSHYATYSNKDLEFLKIEICDNHGYD